ncbi:uncharacterized protein RJT20DRAFT_124433 [Scheffersomyces xylosifermentans]|uniref:uncharacterized protein n=1 Tax=Scheffersomyces xylosifermentans TaxID=1304137 RepID=UPI00315D2A37
MAYSSFFADSTILLGIIVTVIASIPRLCEQIKEGHQKGKPTSQFSIHRLCYVTTFFGVGVPFCVAVATRR